MVWLSFKLISLKMCTINWLHDRNLCFRYVCTKTLKCNCNEFYCCDSVFFSLFVYFGMNGRRRRWILNHFQMFSRPFSPNFWRNTNECNQRGTSHGLCYFLSSTRKSYIRCFEYNTPIFRSLTSKCVFVWWWGVVIIIIISLDIIFHKKLNELSVQP